MTSEKIFPNKNSKPHTWCHGFLKGRAKVFKVADGSIHLGMPRALELRSRTPWPVLILGWHVGVLSSYRVWDGALWFQSWSVIKTIMTYCMCIFTHTVHILVTWKSSSDGLHQLAKLIRYIGYIHTCIRVSSWYTQKYILRTAHTGTGVSLVYHTLNHENVHWDSERWCILGSWSHKFWASLSSRSNQD